MGQMTHGLLYGVKVPEGLDLHGEDGETYDPERGLLRRSEKHFKAEIEAYDQANPFVDWRTVRGADLYVPATNYGDVEEYYVGFWVAVGASGHRGVPYLGRFTLKGMDKKYGAEVAAAKERWDRFAAWAKAEGSSMPEAELHLVETEVA